MAHTELIAKLRKYKPQSGYAWNCYAAADAIEKLESRIAELTLDAERYKIVRRMNPRKFGEVWNENVTTGLHFDWLIDAMKPAQPLPDNVGVSGAEPQAERPTRRES